MKNIILIPLLLFISNTSQAQIQVGFKTGANFTQFMYNGQGEELYANGTSHGIQVSTPFKNRFELQFGLLRTTSGLDLMGLYGWCGNTQNDPKTVINSTNVELQSSIKYHLRKGKGIRPFVGLGISQLYEIKNISYGLEASNDHTYRNIWGDGGIKSSKYNIVALGELGMNFKLGKRFTLDISTTIRNSTFSRANFTSKNLYSAGFGLNYKI